MIREIFLLQNPWRNNKEYSFELKNREILKTILENMDNELILGLLGSRQVGKSSLLWLMIEDLLQKGTPSNNIFYFNLDDLHLHRLFFSLPEFFQFIGLGTEKKYIFIDEIQRLDSPGLFLKEVFDLKKNIKIIYSGSSQLEIKSKTKEHLPGRARVFSINRLSFTEYLDFAAPITKEETLNQILLYGSYPAVALESSSVNKKLRIKDIFQSYIQKDLVDFLNLKEVDSYNKLLIRLAIQSGNLLNIHNISNTLGMSRSKVVEYLNILEYTFVCKRIYPFHKNLQKEIVKTPKLYFLDLGLRNFILNNFNELTIRNDTGLLFENFYLTEVLSKDFYSLNKVNFWRTTNKTEIDFIIQDESVLRAVEIKWTNKKEPRSFQTIKSLYPGIKTCVITRDEFY